MQDRLRVNTSEERLKANILDTQTRKPLRKQTLPSMRFYQRQ